MPSRSFSGGVLRVQTPSSYDAELAPAEVTRSLPGEPGFAAAAGKAALIDALEENRFELVDRIDLTPRRTRDLDGKPVPNRRGTVRLDVDVPAGEDAVVLLEQDGVYSWHLPTNPAERTRSLDLEPRTAHFEVEVQPRKAPVRRAGGLPAPGAGRRTRGLFGDRVQGAVQAFVFRYAAPALLDKAVETLEEHVRPGLVHITGEDISAWPRFDTLDELHLPTDRPVRLLLFVHGTFSSTVGAFAPLAVTPGAEGFVRTLVSAYDAVIGFDHRTLSVDPRANAKDLLRRLATHGPGSGLVIDIITHSRGGLVTRSFVEDVLPRSDVTATVDTIIFVAATNAGTHLADPARWCDLIDVYTNLAAVTAGSLAMIPGGAPVAVVVGAVVKGIGAFVKYLVSYAAEGDEVPGLQAMIPGGPFVTHINATQPGQPEPGTNWYVVSSNFHVELFDDHHNPPEFPRELAARIADGLMDQVFEADNDLVVDTESMGAIALPAGGYVRASLALGTNEVVYHTNYFSQLTVIEAIAGWLPLGMGAGGGEERGRDLEMAEPPPLGFDVQGAGLGAGPLPPPPPPPPPPMPAGPGRLPAAPRPTTPPQPALGEPAGLTEAHVSAEMPATVVVAMAFTLRVRLSRKAVEATPGAAHEEDVIHVDAARPLSVRVVGKRNATVVGADSDVFALPPGGGTSELTFSLRADHLGPVLVTVVVLQGTVPLSTMTLESEGVAQAPALATPAQGRTRRQGVLGLDAPELERLPCLQIFEVERDGKVVYEYAVRVTPGGEVRRFESPPLKERAKFVAGILAQVEDAWIDSGDRPKAFLRRVQDVGAALFEQLFPQEMQEYLWDNRDRLGHLLVYADEPYVPWELVHLKPPVGRREELPRFLAQGGLVRWQFQGFPPKVLPVRQGRARSLCPSYLDPKYALTEPALEEQYLTEHFGAKPVRATPSGVADVLRSGRFDLLHFSGHGAADPEDIVDAKVLLAGRRRGRTIVPQYLSATTVSENASWGADGRPGPVVVLNACQVGRGGEQLSTAGGFAKAFLEAGASAFVSCLWSVREEPSRVFVEELYEQLLAGVPVAEASMAAREKAREAGDATWLSYVIYARPDAVLERR
jgi:hypothetical protein